MVRPAFIAFCACWMVLFSGPVAFGSDAPTSQTLLGKFGDDLAQAWVDYSKDNQKTVRDQRITDLNTQFTKDIVNANAPQNFTMEKAVNTYLDNLKKTPNLLKFADKMTAERKLYATASAAAFKREAPLTTDFKANRTTQQVFQMMLDSFVAARENLRTLPIDYKTGAYQTLSNAYGDLIRNASIPDKPDPAEQMNSNIIEARRLFPMTSPDLKLTNEPIFNLLETSARQIEQRAIQNKK